MPSKPVIQFFFSDFAGDTLGLSDAEVGSYLLLLGAMWNAGGYLPNDSNRLRRIARCPPRYWAERWAVLLPFFQIAAQGITNGRLLDDLAHVEATQAKRSQAGEKGAAARWSKRPKRSKR